MLAQLPSVFLDVVAPVFAIVAIGWALGPRLGLDPKTLSRAAYYVLVPAFTFDGNEERAREAAEHRVADLPAFSERCLPACSHVVDLSVFLGKLHLRDVRLGMAGGPPLVDALLQADLGEALRIFQVERRQGQQHAVLAGEAIVEVPLPANDFEYGGVLRDVDELRPCEQSRRQHRGDADGGQQDEPSLELLVLRFIVRALRFSAPVAQHAIGHEQVDDDEDEPRHPERDRNGVVDRPPVGRDRCEVPGT